MDSKPSEAEDKKGAAVRFPPPLVFLMLLAGGYALEQFWPLAAGSWSGLRFLGAGLALLGAGVIIAVSLAFRRASTSIEPWKPTSTIITSGIYAWSRNPIYFGMCLIAAGIGLYFNSVWMMLSALPSAVLVYYLAIRKEERYLEKKFGSEYRDYCKRVRRWF